MVTQKDADEAAEMQNKLDFFSASTLASTQRILDYCNESESAGVATTRVLDSQNNKITNMERGLYKMTDDIDHIEDDLNTIKQSSGCFPSCFGCGRRSKKRRRGRKKKRIEVTKEVKKVPSKVTVTQHQNNPSKVTLVKSFLVQNVTSSLTSLGSSASKRNIRGEGQRRSTITLSLNIETLKKGGGSTTSVNENQLDKNLRLIGSKLEMLGHMADDIGQTIDTQNVVLNKTCEMTERAVDKVRFADETGKKLLKKGGGAGGKNQSSSRDASLSSSNKKKPTPNVAQQPQRRRSSSCSSGVNNNKINTTTKRKKNTSRSSSTKRSRSNSFSSTAVRAAARAYMPPTSTSTKAKR